MTTSEKSLERTASGVIALSALISIAALVFDQGPAASETRAILEQMAALAQLRGAIHAVQILCLAGLAFGYSAFAARLDLKRPAVMAGLVLFAGGCLVMIVTAVFDGFITQGVAARFAASPDGDMEIARDLLRFCGIVVEYLGDVSFALLAGGTLLWAITLCRGRGLERIVGLIGVAAGILPLAILGYNPHLDLPMLLVIVFGQVLWNLATAAVLARGLNQNSAPSAAH